MISSYPIDLNCIQLIQLPLVDSNAFGGLNWIQLQHFILTTVFSVDSIHCKWTQINNFMIVFSNNSVFSLLN